MYEPAPAPPVPEAPAVPRAQTGRYVYLVTRLRNRQITMEEATELFAIQQAMIRQNAAAAMAVAPSPSPVARSPASAPKVTNSPAGGALLSDEGLALFLLALGTGAGLLGAMAKRARAPSAATPPSSRSNTPP